MSIDEQCLKVIFPNDHFKELISSRYKSELEAVAKEYLGQSACCEFFVGSSQAVARTPPPKHSRIPQAVWWIRPTARIQIKNIRLKH